MNKKEIATGIYVYENVVPGYETIIEELESAAAKKIVTWLAASVKSDDYDSVDTTKRDTQTLGIPYFNPSEQTGSFYDLLSKRLFDAFDPVERDYCSTFGINMSWHDLYGVLKYGVGQKFTNHIDDHKDYLRRMSTVYYLNDDYTGGEINFPRFGVSYKPKANEMIVFPSNFVYNHSVSEVTNGTRYAVVSWLH